MIAVISHDAGGAEILSSYVSRNKLRYKLILEGPAVTIFKRKIKNVETIELNEALITCDGFLCGSSWQSDLEWQAIKQAKAMKKPVYCFLDHWCNYKERFNKKGSQELPDEIWVSDTQAKDIALKNFPLATVKLVKNPYFEDIKDNIKNLQLNGQNTESKGCILFVCEPISEHAEKEYKNPMHWGYTEFTALDYFLNHIVSIEKHISKITIRPHPSEKKDKYDYLLDKKNYPIAIGGENNLLEEILKNDIIVGCESMAMIIGLIAKRRVISAIPPEGKDCILPHPEIEHLKSFIHKH